MNSDETKRAGADARKPAGEDLLPEPPESIFDENGALTRAFLLSRGGCCGSRCRNCPYGWVAVPEVRRGPL